MSTKSVIRVSEFEKLYYDPEGVQPFRKKHWDALCIYLENINKKEEKRVEYFRIINKGIQFTNFVGVIQAGNLTIEILPKIDKGSTIAANESIETLDQQTAKEKSKWQKVLLNMLKECRLIRVHHVDYANLSLRSNSILDIYLELFLTEAENLLREGLLKKYQKVEGNQTALKGQIQFSRQIAYNSIHQERFYVRSTEYNRNNIYNQIIYKALCLIPRISRSTYLLDKVGRLQLDYPAVSNCNVNEETFNHIQFDRKTDRYREALIISKMLLLNFRPDITGGNENVLAILFDMNKLWEEFVYRQLKKEESNYQIQVLPQQFENFWKPSNAISSKTIRPDIILKYKSQERDYVTVLDTKWKVLVNMVPSDEDLKQMFVYNLFWKCDKSVLLYPSTIPASGSGDYHYQVSYSNNNTCAIETISVLDESTRELRTNLGEIILRAVIGKDRLSVLRK